MNVIIFLDYWKLIINKIHIVNKNSNIYIVSILLYYL